MKVKPSGCDSNCKCHTHKIACIAVVVLSIFAIAYGFHRYTLRSIEKHLFNNPDIIIEALQNKQRMEIERAHEQQMEALRLMYPIMASDTSTPSLGKADSTRVIVMFSDYNCEFCKQMHTRLTEMLKKHPDIKIVMKELPVLAPTSELAARAALAANKQGRFRQMHAALMANKGEITDTLITNIATRNNINVTRLRTDMQSQEVTQQLETNLAIANALGIRGIPTMIIGDQMLSGGADEITILEALDRI